MVQSHSFILSPTLTYSGINMHHSSDNTVLFRRFLLVTVGIAIMGILLAQLIAATQRHDRTFSVHNYQQQWEEVQTSACPEHHCALGVRLTSVA